MKRFYDEVSVAEADAGWRVLLDGKPIRTQGGGAQIVPTRALADALAEEWRAQGEKLDLSAFPLRDAADHAIDVVAGDRAATIEQLLGFAETDTLCYRADPEDALFRRQEDMWEPLVTALESREGIRLQRISGVMHRPQRPETLAALRARLEGLDSFALAGVQAMASLAASLCVALAALDADADTEALWSAASLEEDWQAEQWGRDEEAEERRARRSADFARAVRFTRLASET